ncbi:MAG: AAA family ATPase [Promethearchaeota archaeon]
MEEKLFQRSSYDQSWEKNKNIINKLKIAVTGKGGSGKTTFVLLLAKTIIAETNKSILLIDADPTLSHLAKILGIDMNQKENSQKSIRFIQQEIINAAQFYDVEEKRILAESLNDIINEIIFHQKDFDLIVMGQPKSAGCFCPINTLLREVIEQVSNKYDIVIIDCEAGLEQIHREIIKNIDFLVVLSEPIQRGIATANAIIESAKKFMNPKHFGLILNKTNLENLCKIDLDLINEFFSNLFKNINRYYQIDSIFSPFRRGLYDLLDAINLIGFIPYNDLIMDYDEKGIPLNQLEIPERIKIPLKNIFSRIKNYFAGNYDETLSLDKYNNLEKLIECLELNKRRDWHIYIDPSKKSNPIKHKTIKLVSYLDGEVAEIKYVIIKILDRLFNDLFFD